MKFCATLSFTDPTHYVELAKLAEETGWDTLVLSDHLVHPEKIRTRYPYNETGERPWEASAPFPDVWVSMGAMAAVTERLRFLTGVYVLPLRNPFAVAKSLGTAAVMSDYRVSLSLGLGWMEDEFELLGQEFRNRGARAEEMIEVMRKLWTGQMVEHHGTHYDFDRLLMSPAVTGPVPIIVGGTSDLALRRVARIGDGWIPHQLSLAEFEAKIRQIRVYRAECGRESDSLEVVGACTDAIDVDGYRRLEDVGVTHLWTMPWLFYGGSGASLADKRVGFERFSEDVIAKFR